jgi:endonuclease/exonuclease/phosphatase family metal-dependent hydrolase
MLFPRAFFTLFSVVLLHTLSLCNLVVVSWNIKDFGQSRSEEEMSNIASMIRHADIVILQEVVAKHPGGAQAVARLADNLNRMGSKWDYAISDPTNSPSSQISERYAYLWKTSKVQKHGDASLLSPLSQIVHREPYYIRFMVGANFLDIINYHSRTHVAKANGEELEVSAISDWLEAFQADNIILAGDFNLEHTHDVFNKIKMNGYQNCLDGDKTSLKQTCKEGNYLSSAEDNIFIKSLHFVVQEAKVLSFINNDNCHLLKDLRNSYSDHLPIQITLK